MSSYVPWQRSSVIDNIHPLDRLWHAALLIDGSRCLLGSPDDDYAVADTTTGKVIWTDVGPDYSDLPGLAEWIVGEHIEIPDASLKGRYRLFGLENSCHHPLVHSAGDGTELTINLSARRLLIRESATQQVVQSLPYEVLSGDWAFASFSDDYSTIAVLEPYAVTIFRRALKGR